MWLTLDAVPLVKGVVGRLLRSLKCKFDTTVFTPEDKFRFDLVGVSFGKLRIDWSPKSTLELGPFLLKSFDVVELFSTNIFPIFTVVELVSANVD